MRGAKRAGLRRREKDPGDTDKMVVGRCVRGVSSVGGDGKRRDLWGGERD